MELPIENGTASRTVWAATVVNSGDTFPYPKRVLIDADSGERIRAESTPDDPADGDLAALRNLLETGSRHKRHMAATRLATLEPDEANVAALLKALRDPCWWVRRDVVQALRGNPDRSLRDALAELQERDPEPKVRDAVRELLRRS